MHKPMRMVWMALPVAGLALLAGCSSSGGKMAAPAAASVQVPVAQKDARGSYRFLMQQEGKNMSADQFDAWMRANGMRVARGKPTAPARKARRP